MIKNTLLKWTWKVALPAALMAFASYWFSHVNSEAAQSDATHTRVLVLEQRATVLEQDRDEVKHRLERMEDKIDRIWEKVKK